MNPAYGTVADLRALVAAAHRRGIQVILDVALNHTSAAHPWFVASAASKTARERAFYIWAEDTGRPMPSEGAVPDTPPWHEKNGAHYLGIFHPGMPDLDFDQPAVRKEMAAVGRFWLEQGVDGLRLDAAKHVYEDFKGTARSPEVVKKNGAWWREFRTELDRVRPGAFLVGEVWDRPDVVAPYLATFQASFNFDLATKLVAAAREEKAQGIGAWLEEIHRAYDAAAGSRWVDAPFLTNHDQNRVMSDVGGNADRARTAAALLLTMPGRPFLYYGEEIGMRGIKPDETIREPFVWSARPRPGDLQARWEPLRHNAHGEAALDVEARDPGSLLAHYRRLIGWRNALPALASNAIAPFDAGSPAVEGYVRGEGADRLLVLVNLGPAPARANAGGFGAVLHATREGAKLAAGAIELPGYTAAILR